MNFPAQTAVETKEQQTPVEAGVKEPVIPEKKDDFDSRFAALAKKERMIRDRESRYKSEFEPKLNEFNKLNTIKERAKQRDPYAIREALDYLGLSADDINEVLLTNPATPKDPEVLAIRKQLEEMQKEKNARLKEDNERKVQENIKSFKSDINKGIKANLEKYELCNLYDEAAVELASQFCEEH